jgi:hypothetical protein
MDTQHKRSNLNKVALILDKLAQLNSEFEMLNELLESRELERYDLESDIATALFQLNTMLKKATDTNNQIYIDIVKESKSGRNGNNLLQ